MNKFSFTKKIEKMISPQDIATLQMISPLNKFLPAKIQNKIINSSAKKNPYMGFVVEPYSFFLCYEITDQKYAQSLVHSDFEVVKTSIFADDEPKYYFIFTLYNIHSSAFWGTRLEMNVIARNKNNGLVSWVIVDYDTNALSHDIKRGVISSTTSDAIFTTDFAGNIIVDITNKEKNTNLVVNASTNAGIKKSLNQELWLDGNLSIGYGKEISNNSNEAFSLIFDPNEVTEAFSIPLDDVNIDANNWFPNLFKEQPTFAVYFPFAQHFLSDSPGHTSNIKNEADMVQKKASLHLATIPDYSSAGLRKMLKIGFIFNVVISWTLIFIILYLIL